MVNDLRHPDTDNVLFPAKVSQSILAVSIRANITVSVVYLCLGQCTMWSIRKSCVFGCVWLLHKLLSMNLAIVLIGVRFIFHTGEWRRANGPIKSIT
jgi:hypothetical protein